MRLAHGFTKHAAKFTDRTFREILIVAVCFNWSYIGSGFEGLSEKFALLVPLRYLG
jgi:hypothetical protein